MNFAECLWDKFTVVNSHNMDRRRKAEDFLTLLKASIATEETYARDLERMAGHSFLSMGHGTLTSTIATVRNGLLNKSMQAKLEAQKLRGVSHQICVLLNNQAISIKKPAGEGKKIDS